MSSTPLEIFRARAETRARLLYVGLYRDIDHAMQPLLSDARESGLFASTGEERLRAIINDELQKVGMHEL